MCMRISSWCAHAHLILMCACASHFGMHMRMLTWGGFTYLVKRKILASLCFSNVPCPYEKHYSSARDLEILGKFHVNFKAVKHQKFALLVIFGETSF